MDIKRYTVIAATCSFPYHIRGLQNLTAHFCPVVHREQHLWLLSVGVNHKTHTQEHNLITATRKVERRADRNPRSACAPFSSASNFPAALSIMDSDLSLFLSLICHTGFKRLFCGWFIMWDVPDVNTVCCGCVSGANNTAPPYHSWIEACCLVMKSKWVDIPLGSWAA